MFAICVVYTGFIVTLLGGVSLVKPLAFLGMRSRRGGALLLVFGILMIAVGWALPAKEITVAVRQTQLDEFAPVYEFSEVHSVRVKAPRGQVFQAIKAVTADEILFLRTLTWLRRLGRPGPESILSAQEHLPLLEVATRTSFLLLAEVPDREIVVGTVVLAPSETRPRKLRLPEDFKAIHEPGFAVAAMNFLLEDAGPGASVVTTETRVYTTDPSARSRFARYWRVIYPGSAVIRRMWLRAVQRRAEGVTRREEVPPGSARAYFLTWPEA